MSRVESSRLNLVYARNAHTVSYASPMKNLKKSLCEWKTSNKEAMMMRQLHPVRTVSCHRKNNIVSHTDKTIPVAMALRH